MVSIWDYNSHCCSGNSSNNNNNNKINKKNNNRLQKKEQIPTEYNEEQIVRIIRKQDQISGVRRRAKYCSISTASKGFRVSCR